MGILNLTHDSFFDGGRYTRYELALQHCEQMLQQGAAIIDVGAQSTRPSATLLSAFEEIKMLEDFLPRLVSRFSDTLFSIDTFYGEVVRFAAQNGVGMVNDVSAGSLDSEMLYAVAESRLPYILMHMKGTPQNMHLLAEYTDVTDDVTVFLATQMQKLYNMGIVDIWVDPGFGFSKKTEHNYSLLRGLKNLKILGVPVVAGMSRKSMITRILQIAPDHALNGTTVLNTIALIHGADVLRVHDVKEAKEAIKLVKTYFSNPMNE